jgi:hypothetical protein
VLLPTSHIATIIIIIIITISILFIVIIAISIFIFVALAHRTDYFTILPFDWEGFLYCKRLHPSRRESFSLQ